MPKIFNIDVNDAQYKAIIHGAGPMLVLAGPGSGKTTVITHRIRYLIEQHKISPEDILVITFTKAAAREMQERFLSLMNGSFYPVTFGTFHAIYFHIIQQVYHFDASNIIKENEKRKALDIAMKKAGFQSLHGKTQSDSLLQTEIQQLVLSEISHIKNTGLDYKSFQSIVLEEEQFRKVYVYYHKIIREQRKIDFDDMVLLCKQLFMQRPDILSAWQNKYQYILIDEFQDICPMQYDVVTMLSQKSRNLFIVGDDDQSIYHFRGSNPQIMLDFPKKFPDGQKVLLNINYRSDAEILKYSLNLIQNNQNRYQKEILPCQKFNRNSKNNIEKLDQNIAHDQQRENAVEYKTFYQDSLQMIDICEKIKESVKQGGSFHDIAILTRTNTGIEKWADLLMANKIPFAVKERIQNKYKQFYIQDIISYLQFACIAPKREYFIRFMNKPLRYFNRDSLQKENVLKQDLLTYYKDKKYMITEIETLWRNVILLKNMSPYAAINFIRKGIGYDHYLKEYAIEKRFDYSDWEKNINSFQEKAKEFDYIKEFIEYIDQYEEILNVNNTGKNIAQNHEKDAVEIITMHASKGLEWKYVFLPDLNEKVIPHKKAETKEEIEEERRMLYVAMTRAKRKLFLSAIDNSNNVEKEKQMIPTRFIKEIFELESQ